MHIIVGIDTGKTMAFSCLSLEGRLVRTEHKSSAGLDWIIDAIGKVGIPSIIAYDKKPNETVRKIAAAFNAKLYCPKKEMSIEEKMLAAKPFGVTNPHERDALSSAIKAYNQHANKLKQAEHIARMNNIEEVDKIKAKVIEKYSINEAITSKEANRK